MSSFAGGGSPGGRTSGHDDGLGSAATFYAPTGVALDSSGSLYVTDFRNQLVRKISPAGNVLRA